MTAFSEDRHTGSGPPSLVHRYFLALKCWYLAFIIEFVCRVLIDTTSIFSMDTQQQMAQAANSVSQFYLIFSVFCESVIVLSLYQCMSLVPAGIVSAIALLAFDRRRPLTYIPSMAVLCASAIVTWILYRDHIAPIRSAIWHRGIDNPPYAGALILHLIIFAIAVLIFSRSRQKTDAWNV
jgi:hypothetical protein